MRKLSNIRLIAALVFSLSLVFGGTVAASAQVGDGGPGAGQSGSIAINAHVSDQVGEFVFQVDEGFGVASATTEGVGSDEAGPDAGRAFDLYLGETVTQSPAFSVYTNDAGVAQMNGVPEGTHTLVDRVTLNQLEVTVSIGTTTSVTHIASLNPGSGDSDVASLAVNTFTTDSIDQVQFTTDTFGGGPADPATAAANAPGTGPGQNVQPVEREYNVYFGTDTNAQPVATIYTAGGSAVVNDLGTGLYTVQDLGTGDQFQIELVAGEFGTVTVFYPSTIFGGW